MPGALPGCSDAEWATRVDLAAAYRLCYKLGLSEGICNHLTAVVPGDPSLFLCIPYSLLWSEVTPGNLLTVDMAGKVVRGVGEPEQTAFWIHSRIHERRPVEAAAVFHTHMPYATALCCVEPMRLMMVHQNSLRFWNDVAYDEEFNGLVTDRREGDRVAEALGGKKVAMHAHHGVIVVGRSVAQAFDDLYYLERAAEVQVKALSTGCKVRTIGDDVATLFKEDMDKDGEKWARLHFEAQKRELERN